jgi:hypothetical protein
VLLASAAAFVVAATALGSASEGPIGATIEALATIVRSMEHRVRERINGPGRRRNLEWFEPARAHPLRLRQPERLLLGAYEEKVPDSLEGVVALERMLGTTFPLVQIYTAWGDQAEHQFPRRVATTIWNMGSVPVVTWEPWLATFDNARHSHLPLREQRDRHGLAAVARGDYDFYIDEWAADAARFAHPLFVRFAHEMNDPYRYPWGPQNNTKEEFIAAWHHVVDRFRRAQAGNVIWVWSPHVAYQYWDLYYPGGDDVDWVATGVLNYGPIAQWSQWWSFDEILETKYSRLESFGKPVMVAEFGSLAVGGDRAGWYRDALDRLPERYPAIKALLFFEVRRDRSVTYQHVDWSVAGDEAVVRTVTDAVAGWAAPSQGQ